jgi:putative flippase GtrA
VTLSPLFWKKFTVCIDAAAVVSTARHGRQSRSPDHPGVFLSTQNALFGQLLRYGITGAGLALAFAVVYEAVLRVIAGAPQLANALAFFASTALGYVIHSRWSFRGHGQGDALLPSALKFFVVNVGSFAANVFWVWLLVNNLDLSRHAPLLPILGLTPWVSFWLNRNWTFVAAKLEGKVEALASPHCDDEGREA